MRAAFMDDVFKLYLYPAEGPDWCVYARKVHAVPCVQLSALQECNEGVVEVLWDCVNKNDSVELCGSAHRYCSASIQGGGFSF